MKKNWNKGVNNQCSYDLLPCIDKIAPTNPFVNTWNGFKIFFFFFGIPAGVIFGGAESTITPFIFFFNDLN